MTTYYVNSNNCAPWLPLTVYGLGARCVCTIGNTSSTRQHNVYECTQGGTSAASEPAFNLTVGNTITDGTVIWTTRRANSWDNAHHSLIMILKVGNTVIAEGSIFLVHKTHNENIGSDYGTAFPYGSGGCANPTVCVCVDKDNSDALSSGAVVTIGKDKFHWYHNVFINIKISTAFNWASTNHSSVFMIGTVPGLTLLELTGATNGIMPEDLSNQVWRIINGNVNLANAANHISPSRLHWKGGTLIAPNGVNILYDLSLTGAYQHQLEINSVNLTAVGAGTLVKVVDGVLASELKIIRCKLPSNLGGVISAPFPADVGYQSKVIVHQCSYDQKTWGFSEWQNEGSIIPETTIVRTGGASDGITPISWEMASTTQTDELTYPLESPSINLWNSSTSEMTLTIHGILDSATNLQDDEIWLEVEYPADTTSGLGALESTRVVYAGMANLPASTEAWTESMANPNKFKLVATFTPAQAGPIAAKVCLGKASTTVYVCPKAEIS